MVQNASPTQRHKINTGIKDIFHIGTAHDFTGHGEFGVFSIQSGENINQTLPLISALLDFLKHIPQRHVDEVKLATSAEALKISGNLVYLHAKAGWR